MMNKLVLLAFGIAIEFSLLSCTKGQEIHVCLPTNGQDTYGELLDMSYIFYEAQQSGYLSDFNRVKWRKDSALDDAGPNGQDLTGGWYDAGDHLKFALTTAYTVHKLAWGFIEFEEGYSGYEEVALDNIQFALDFLRKSILVQTDDPTAVQLAVQVGKLRADHEYWGRAEDMQMERPVKVVNCSFPGSEPAALTSAAFSASYLLFQQTNTTYAKYLLNHAELLYLFAEQCQGKWSDSVLKGVEAGYRSSHYEDELALAAAWLYKVTNDSLYLQQARKFYQEASYLSTALNTDWDNNYWSAVMTLFEVDTELQDEYQQKIDMFFEEWSNPEECPDNPNHDFGLCRTPQGLSFMAKWGSLRHTMNAAFLAMLYSKYSQNQINLQQWACNQLQYTINGDISYVVGYGFSFPLKPHHRGSSCPIDGPCGWGNFESKDSNPQILYGALVGGPSHLDYYYDRRQDFVHNEVAIDYNAGYTGVLAAMREFGVVC